MDDHNPDPPRSLLVHVLDPHRGPALGPGDTLTTARHRAGLACALTLVIACGCAPAPTPPAAPIAQPASARDATASVSGAGRVTEVAALESGLSEAGIAFRFDAETELDYLPGLARIYQIGEGSDSLQVHAYPSLAEAEDSAALIGPDARWIDDPSDPEDPWYVDWKGSPQAYRSGPLLAIYIGQDARILAALEALLGAPFAGAGAAP